MEDAVTDLESGLTQLGLTHDIVLIRHSYAGAIATYFVMRHPDWVSGAVLVDTNVPEFFTDEEVAHMWPIIQPMARRRSSRAPKQTDANSESNYRCLCREQPRLSQGRLAGFDSVHGNRLRTDALPTRHDLRYRALDTGPQGLRGQIAESKVYFRQGQLARHCPRSPRIDRGGSWEVSRST